MTCSIIPDEGAYKKYGWQKKTVAVYNGIADILNASTHFWPVTIRRVFYRCVATALLMNTRSCYQSVSKILRKARMQGLVPWDAIEDRVRGSLDHRVFDDANAYVKVETDWYLNDYKRNLLQEQERDIELWTEKDTLAPYLQRIVTPHRVDVFIARGFSSVSFVRDLYNRVIRRMATNERRTHLLHVGDADPSGMFMPEYMFNTLREVAEMDDIDAHSLDVMVDVQRITLDPEQAVEMDLPPNFEGIKHEDSRAARYIGDFATDEVWEADALEFEVLERMVVEAVEENLDLDKFNRQVEMETAELKRIAKLKAAVDKYAKRKWREFRD